MSSQTKFKTDIKTDKKTVFSLPAAWSFNKIICNNQNEAVDFLLLDFNDEFKTIFQLSGAEKPDQKASQLIPELIEHYPELLRVFGRVSSSGKKENIEYCREAEEKWFLLTVASVQNEYFTVVYTDISDRKKIEQELKEENQSYHSFFNELREEIIVIDNKYKITDSNNSFLLTSGYSRDEVIGRHCYEILRGSNEPCVTKQMNCPLTNVFLTGESDTCTHDYLKKDGSEAVLDLFLYPQINPGGKVKHVIASIQDITDRKRLQKELQISKERFNTAQHIARMGDFICIPDMGEITCSEPLLDLLHFTEADIPDFKSFIEKIIHPDDSKRVTDWLGAVHSSEKMLLIPIEYRVMQKDGSVLQVRSLGVINRPDEKTAQAFATVQDITARKKAEQELAENEERYRALFEDSPVPLWELDLSGIKLYFDQIKKKPIKNFRKYFEQKPEKVAECLQLIKILKINNLVLADLGARNKNELRENFLNLFTKDSLKDFAEQLIAMAEERPEFEFDLIIKTFKHDKRVFQLKWNIVPGYEESLERIYLSSVDITARRQTEEQLAKYHQQLEKLVEERTEKLAQKNNELERFNKLFVGREFRIKELRSKINILEKNQT